MNLLAKPTSPFQKKHTKQTVPGFRNLGLHSAAASGNLGLVKFALDQGQPIDSVVHGLLPIHAACCTGNAAVVEYLVQRGADVNCRSYSKHYTGANDILRENSNYHGTSALHFAVAKGDLEIVEILLRYGASVDTKDKYGCTPLNLAEAKQFKEIRRHLLKAGSQETSTVVSHSSETDPLTLEPKLTPELVSLRGFFKTQIELVH
ncbi:ankyrin [Basidiobolus meristosporus CBS 931.73]|uniref:Ankyrin n=1 Tax=Basidiobolus meristosporus CBS 931.73 TaxID=1314790 RepID=A0A1Y1XWB0_9FUNG|nr:ankyrin [Basidiobolus meristosporus CBS 931.73]|eukprot:ORX90041.1 ankyrin [Basidiobolus meristosporus CBS 931.73]